MICSGRIVIFLSLGGILGSAILISCKSRLQSNSNEMSDLRVAVQGPSEAELALTELEVVDCSSLADSRCGTGAGDGLALVNPATQDLQFAYSRSGLPVERNPYGAINGESGFDTAFSLAGNAGGTGEVARGAALDDVASVWGDFAANAAPLHKTPSVAAALEALISGVVGPEVTANPALLDPVKFVAALDRLVAIIENFDAGKISEGEAIKQIDRIAREGGFGHPAFDRLAARAASGPPGSVATETAYGLIAADDAKTDNFARSLNTDFADLRAMTIWYDQNLVAVSKAEKIRLVSTLKDLLPQVRKLEGILERHKISDESKVAIMEALRVVAGQDGFINQGDLPRILPVVPDLVGQVADRKIEHGFADGIAKLRASKPFVYRRWARASNGLVGRVVNREINKNLSQAYAQKMAAINQVSASLQQAFTLSMSKMGVRRYFVEVDSSKNYYDPARILELAHVDRVVRAMSGRSSIDIATELESTGGAGGGGALSGVSVQELARDLEIPMTNLFQRVELPDGLFVRDGLELVEKKQSDPSRLALSGNLQFVLGSSGKVLIGRRRFPCSCEYSNRVQQCVFLFKPYAKPSEAANVLFYQPLGKVAGPVGNNCDFENQCVPQFGRQDFQFHMPYTCGGYFWGRPEGRLHTGYH